MPRVRQATLSSWGRMTVPGVEVRSEDLPKITEHVPLTRGMGRSYGDSSLPAPGQKVVAGSTLADRILSFDPTTGVMRAEAGLILAEVNRIFLPRGFFSPVTPGTAFVTLGGMVASDVHGKNHHRDGCFGEYVRSVLLRVADGRILECSREKEPELFRATLGGMGLTGHILEVEFTMSKVPSPWIFQETFRVRNIDEYIDGLKDSGPLWPFTMGWIDCLSTGKNLGRGILYRGRWAEPSEAPRHFPKPKPRLTLPFDLPSWLLNPLSIAAFNTLNYWKHPSRVKGGIVHPDDFFYPLDKIRAWNRMYGRKGFTQYQCVLPDEAGRGAARRFLELLTSKGGASFLCVIKDCGKEGTGLLSFPKPGVSIPLDIPIRENTQELIDALNEFVVKEGGRIYLTKDGFTRPEHFRAMEPRLDEFLRIRKQWDPELKLKSAQSVRVFGDPA